MTKEEFIQECIEKGTSPCRYINKRAHELYDRLAPVLKEEDRLLLGELIDDLPHENEIVVKLFVPKGLMLDENFQEFLWMWKELSQKGDGNQDDGKAEGLHKGVR